MAVTTKYEAKDGKQFTDRQEAYEWDNSNFEMWLDSGATIPAQHFIECMTTLSDCYDRVTDRTLARQLLRKYWDTYVK